MAKQKMVPFHVAVKNFFTRYFEFSGTTTRSEYWFAILFLWLMGMVLALIGVGLLDNIWSLAIFIPQLAMGARRFHDAGYSTKRFFGLVGTIFVLYIFMAALTLLGEAGYEMAWGWAEIPAMLSVFAVLGLTIYTIYIMCKPTKVISKTKRAKKK
ncbi:MAG: DUF805 domain-containing protein [Alphaproteobacteria bacterium]|nr:DUF805 domain-containing protein [Alphaproteobacteria bacterium]